MLDPIVAFDKLAQFETADEIAQYLMASGIKGKQFGASSCAIAQYMWEATGKVAEVFPGQIFTDSIEPHTTPAMVEFIVNFDKGHYPELVAGNFVVCGDVVYHK